MLTAVLALSLGLGGSPSEPAECRDKPSRVSDGYWAHVGACGCSGLEPPSRASADYERYLKACSRWRERNQKVTVVVVPEGAAPREASAAPPTECRNPPSRAASTFWTFIEACGCEDVEPPSSTSDDYPRFMKACSEWRARHPSLVAPAASPGSASSPSPR